MIELLEFLIQYHSFETSLDSRSIKDGVNFLIFELVDNLRAKNGEEWFNLHIYTKGDLYCWTKDKIQTLNKIQEQVYLCCSTDRNGFNPHSALFNRPYKYQYRLSLKENTYGILINSFSVHTHRREKECLIKLQDIAQYELVQINK